jgi:hypothetical protein
VLDIFGGGKERQSLSESEEFETDSRSGGGVELREEGVGERERGKVTSLGVVREGGSGWWTVRTGLARLAARLRVVRGRTIDGWRDSLVMGVFSEIKG